MAEVVKNYDSKSSTVLNAIVGGASADVQERVGTVTLNNLAKVGDAILNYQETRNVAIKALFDKIGATMIASKRYKNPLAMFKTPPMNYGKFIEEMFVDIVDAQDFDFTSEELNKRFAPNISTYFHMVNRKKKYPVTTDWELIEEAFTTEEGFNTLTNAIVESLITSDEYDEFLTMKSLITTAALDGRIKVVQVPEPLDEASTKACLAKIREVSNLMTFMNPDYNYANVRNHTSKMDQMFLIDAVFDSKVDVEVLAGAFNMEKADVEARKILMDDFGGVENVVGMLCSNKWFTIKDTTYRQESKWNEDTLSMKNWLHHWGIYSSSPFAEAVLFVTVASTVTAIDIVPATATVPAGEAVQFNIEVTGTGVPSAKSTYVSDNADVVVSTTGLAVVSPSASSGTATITATSVENPAVFDTAVITIP